MTYYFKTKARLINKVVDHFRENYLAEILSPTAPINRLDAVIVKISAHLER